MLVDLEKELPPETMTDMQDESNDLFAGISAAGGDSIQQEVVEAPKVTEKGNSCTQTMVEAFTDHSQPRSRVDRTHQCLLLCLRPPHNSHHPRPTSPVHISAQRVCDLLPD